MVLIFIIESNGSFGNFVRVNVSLGVTGAQLRERVRQVVGGLPQLFRGGDPRVAVLDEPTLAAQGIVNGDFIYLAQ